MVPLPIDIVSGFLGAGKTTFIRRLLEGPYRNKRIAVIENDFGETGIDGKLLESTGSRITEIVSGCICCTLALDFQQAIETLAAEPDIERIVIEPSGVAKLTDVLRAVARVSADTVRLGRVVTVVDVNTYPSYAKGFGAFYLDQVMNADAILVSKIGGPAAESASETVRLLRERNPRAEILAVPWHSEEFAGFLEDFDESRDAAAAPAAARGQSTAGRDHSAETFSSVCFEIDRPASTGEISRRVEEILADGGVILRIKGLIDTSDRGPVRVDWAGGILSIEPVAAEPDNRLVVIGKDLSSDLLGALSTE